MSTPSLLPKFHSVMELGAFSEFLSSLPSLRLDLRRCTKSLKKGRLQYGI